MFDHALPDSAAGRIAIYVRISTDECNQPWSLAAQKEKLEAYCRSKELVVCAVYEDQASAKDLDRPGLTHALADAERGVFDTLVVYRIDRLCRRLVDVVTVAEKLQSRGIALRSATEPFDTETPMGLFVVQLLSMFAEFEHNLRVDRIKSGIEQRRKKTAGRRPTGSS